MFNTTKTYLYSIIADSKVTNLVSTGNAIEVLNTLPKNSAIISRILLDSDEVKMWKLFKTRKGKKK